MRGAIVTGNGLGLDFTFHDVLSMRYFPGAGGVHEDATSVALRYFPGAGGVHEDATSVHEGHSTEMLAME